MHYGTGRNAELVKLSAPIFKATAPDSDKLIRLIGDALTIAGVIADDALIVRILAEKRYGLRAFTRVALAEV
jgi:Holliday junction resolvase RusA-like endonuclease